jgi:signal transduction histidine kinase
MLTIMITAYASLETAVTATKRGAYDFLAKPFTPAELKSVVSKAAGRLVLARQARKLAEEKRQVRFQFIRVLGHELKAPLGAIEGYLRIIAERSAGDDPAAYAQMADRSMVRLSGMRKLIEDLLDLTRIESGQKKRELSEVDVRDVAEMAIESFSPAAGEKNVSIDLHAPQSLPLQADRGEIEIILNNLVSNAVKYNREGGRVDVTLTRREDDCIVIEVADTGIGMKPEEAERLFQDFVRIRNAKTRSIPGSGLGLSIVRKLAQLYGGDATVDSTEDVGSTFTVVLDPNAPAPEQDDDAAGTHPLVE